MKMREVLAYEISKSKFPVNTSEAGGPAALELRIYYNRCVKLIRFERAQ